MSPPPSAKGARRRDPEPSEPLGSGPRVKTCSSSCLSWLHPLRSWSLRQTRGGSIPCTRSITPLLRSENDKMDKLEQDALQDCVRGIIEKCVASLIAVGCSNETALRLLMIQGAIRMNDAAEVRSVIKSIESGLIDDDDDEDDDHCGLEGERLG